MCPAAFISFVFLLVSVVATFAQNTDAKIWRDVARTALEGRVRADFELAKTNLLEEGKKRHPEALSAKDINDGIEGLKMLAYNKAYIYYSCILSLGPPAPQDKAISDCVRDPIAEAVATYNLTTQYISLFERNPKAGKCELKARLFKEELEFPPYDFLVGKGINLYDHKVMRACLISSVD